MNDREKTKEQLIEELQRLRQRVAELQTSEAELKRAEEAYRTLVEQSLQGLVIVQDFRIVFANPAFAEISGYTVEKLLSLSPEEVRAMIHPEDQALVWGRFRDRLEGKPVSPRYEYRGIRKDGTVRWLEMFASRVEYYGKPAIQGAIVDITGRKQVGEALRESEEKYRSLVERANDGVVVIQDTLFKYANRRLEEISGYTIEELIDTPFTNYIYPDELPKVVDRYKRRMAGEEVTPIYESAIKHKDGHKIDVEINAAVTTYQGKPADFVIIRDITERKRAEEALREGEEKYRTILENIEDSYYEVDIAGNFTFFNDSLCRISGYPKDELMGMNDRQLMDDETAKAVYQTFNAIYRTGKPVKALEHEFIRKDGTRTFVEVSASLMRGPTGEPAGFRGIIRDITERKWAEEALQQREAVLEAIALAAEKFLQPGDWEQDIQTGLAYLGKAADVSRALIWEASTGDDSKYLINGRHEWIAPEAKLAPLVGLQNVPMFRRWRDLLPRGEIITGHVRDFGAKEQEFFVPRGIKSVLVVPIFVNNAWWGFMGFDQGGTEREWTEAEIDTLKTAASILGGALERKRTEEALRESEENFRALADNANDGIMIAAGKGAHVYANRRMAEITGYSVPELLKTTMADLVHPDQLKEVMERFQRRLEGKPAPRQYEIVFVRKDGKSVPLEMTSAKTVWRGQPATIVVFRDITKRKRAEAERERLLTALERRSTQLQTAAEVSRVTSSILDPDELIQQVVDLIRERFDLYYAGLFLVDETGEWTGEVGKWAVLRAGTGETGRQMLKQGYKLEIGSASMIGWCIANRQARIALDVGGEAVRFENPLLPETRSELALPLISRGRAIGALTIQSAQQAAFSKEDIAVLQTMADQLANSIANARLYGALAREQYLMTTLMDNVPDYIYFKDRESCFIRTTKAHAKTFSLSDPAEAIGKTDFDFFSDEHARQAYEDEQRIVRTGEPLLNVEERETWPDRPDTWVLTSKMPLRDEAGNIVGTFGITRDITERKQAEAERERLLAETNKRVRELYCLNDIGRKIEEIPPVPEFLQWVADRIPPAMQYPDVCRAAIEFDGQVYGAAEAVSLPCQMVQALRIEGEVVGRVYIAYVEEHDFIDEESALLGDIVRRVSGYIESRRLFEQTKQATFLMGERVKELACLNAIGRKMVETPPVPEFLQWVTESIPLAMRHSEVCLVAIEFEGQVYGATEAVSLPCQIVQALRIGGEVVGRVYIAYTEDRNFLDEESALLGDIVRRVSGYIESRRLFEETQRRAEELAALNELGRALTGRMSVKEVLDETYRGATRLLDTTNFFIALYDLAKDEIVFPLDVTEMEEDKFDSLPADKGLTGYIIRNRKSVLIKDNLPERLAEMGMELVGEPAASWLGVPLIVGNQAMGMIGLQSFTTSRAYDEHDQALLTAIASQAAIAIQNARLFEQMQARAERERLVRTIADRVRRGTDTEAIMRIALHELHQMLGASKAVVRLGTREQLSAKPVGPSAELRTDSSQDKPGEGLLSSQEVAARKMEDI